MKTQTNFHFGEEPLKIARGFSVDQETLRLVAQLGAVSRRGAIGVRAQTEAVR